MGQAQWHLEGVKRMRTVPLSEMSTDPMLQMRMDATEQKSEFYQETMENMVLRAETVRTITQPEEPMRFERSGAWVQLLDVSGTLAPDDERSKIYIEHLCAVDPGQYGCLSFGESTEIAYNQVQHLANSFHQRGVKKAKATCDPLVDDAVAIELGYSTMAGGSKLQSIGSLAFRQTALKVGDFSLKSKIPAVRVWSPPPSPP